MGWRLATVISMVEVTIRILAWLEILARFPVAADFSRTTSRPAQAQLTISATKNWPDGVDWAENFDRMGGVDWGERVRR